MAKMRPKMFRFSAKLSDFLFGGARKQIRNGQISHGIQWGFEGDFKRDFKGESSDLPRDSRGIKGMF